MTHITIFVDGEPIQTLPGIPLGAVLHGLKQSHLRLTHRNGAPRGLFCGMGTCFDCLVTIDGIPAQRACITSVRPGMRVERDLEGQGP